MSNTKPRRRLLYGFIGTVCLCGTVLLVTVWKHLDWWRWPLQAVLSTGVRRVEPASPVAAQIVASARAQEGTFYKAHYTQISYPNGDVEDNVGACTDVVIRALRGVGYDLQRLIHEDMKCNFSAYPRKWGLNRPDSNIDHRRVPNQMRFFERHGIKLTNEVSSSTLRHWQPGDFVYWNMGSGQQHTGVLSDGINRDGLPLVIHNGSICVEADCLTRWKIIGHFRYPGKPKIKSQAS